MSGLCEYSVEVKSRFNLFYDESLNEDPEVLLANIQNNRKAEKRDAAAKMRSEPVRPKPADKPVDKEVKKEEQIKGIVHINI